MSRYAIKPNPAKPKNFSLKFHAKKRTSMKGSCALVENEFVYALIMLPLIRLSINHRRFS